MIPSSVPVLLYILAFLMITLPLAGLTVLYLKTRFKIFWYAIPAMICYLLVANLFAPVLWTVISVIISSDPGTYFEARHWLFLLIYSFLTAAFSVLALWLTQKILDKRITLKAPDTLSLGAFYYIFSFMSMALSFVSYARVAIAYNKGELEKLADEALPLETLLGYVEELQGGIMTSSAAQFLSELTLILALAVSMLLLFHAVKKKKFLNVVYAFLLEFGTLLLISYSEYFLNLTAAICTMAVLIACFVFVIVKYLLWYKAERARFAQEMADYKESLKAPKK